MQGHEPCRRSRIMARLGASFFLLHSVKRPPLVPSASPRFCLAPLCRIPVTSAARLSPGWKRPVSPSVAFFVFVACQPPVRPYPSVSGLPAPIPLPTNAYRRRLQVFVAKTNKHEERPGSACALGEAPRDEGRPVKMPLRAQALAPKRLGAPLAQSFSVRHLGRPRHLADRPREQSLVVGQLCHVSIPVATVV